MTQPRLASHHTSCRLNHLSTSVSFPLHRVRPSPPPSSMTAGLQGDSRSPGQHKTVPTPDSAAGGGKRRPGRPRKHPLPSAMSSASHSSAAALRVSPPDLLPERNRDGRDVGGPERDRGGDTAQQVTELELQARKKRGRKRKHGESPCHQR